MTDPTLTPAQLECCKQTALKNYRQDRALMARPATFEDARLLGIMRAQPGQTYYLSCCHSFTSGKPEWDPPVLKVIIQVRRTRPTIHIHDDGGDCLLAQQFQQAVAEEPQSMPLKRIQ